MRNLVLLTQPYQQGYLHVQGAGGNTSVKEAGKMYIKSSGCFFSDIDEENGFSVVEIDKVSPKASWETFVSNHKRPSMEYGFHLLLDTFVLHTHSAAFNVLLCSTDAEQLLSQYFRDFLLVPYLTPGQDLADYMSRKQNPPLVLFSNHGVVVHHHQLENVHKIYQDGIKLLEQKLDLCVPPLKIELGNQETIVYCEEEDLMKDWLTNYLIPDQAIFMHNKMSVSEDDAKPITINLATKEIVVKGTQREQQSIVDMIQMVYYVRYNQKRNQLTPQFLTDNQVAALFNLDAEKYRQQQLAQK